MVVFAVFFAVWTAGAFDQPEVFDAGRRHAGRVFGLVNTLALITSSWCVASGLRLARADRFATAGRLFSAAWGLGAVFVIVKVFEYRHKIQAGADAVNNLFDMYYFVFTGIHLLHVLVGMIVLALMVGRTRKVRRRSADIMFMEGAGAYWHLVDVFWIVLFLLIYIIRV
ncbi:cytochrome c oxidase subunit 3 [Mycobacterium sp. BMJ-28]